MFRNPGIQARRRPRAAARIVATVAAAMLALTALSGVAVAQTTHEVESGDTLAAIAQAHGVGNWRAVYEANDKLDDPNWIYPGQQLVVPTGDGASSGGTTTGSSEPAASEPEPQASTQNAGVWDRLAQCESNGNWSINTGNGYYGGLQFALSSWRWVGGSGYPHEASKAEQIRRAEILLERQGWSAWPACSRQLGLR